MASLEAKLQTFQLLQPSELVSLYQSLEVCTLPQDKVKHLQGIVDSKATGATPGAALKAMMVPQELTTVQNFLTNRDWNQVETLSMRQGIEIITQRLRSLGLCALKESTKRSCVAVVLWFQVQKSGQVPPYPAIYDMAQHLTNAFKAQKCPVGVPMLAVYPHSAAGLSAEHFQKAYKDEVPEPRQLEGLQNLAMNHVPLRSTSNLLAKQTKPNQNLATSTQRPQDTVESAEAKDNFTDFQQHVKTWNDNMALLLAQVAKPTPPTEVKTSSTAAETQPASVQSGK